MKKNSGFTMMELLIVIVILGLLASLVAPKMFGKVSSTKKKTAAAQMQMFETALDTYRLDIGNYPSKLDELVTGKDKNWDGPYLPKNVPVDPWGNPYVYKLSEQQSTGYYLASLGQDGKEGGADDNEDIVHQ